MIIGQYNPYQFSNTFRARPANKNADAFALKDSIDEINIDSQSWDSYVDRKSDIAIQYAKIDGGALFSIEEGKKFWELVGDDYQKMFDMMGQIEGYISNYHGVSVIYVKSIDHAVKNRIITALPDGEFLFSETIKDKKDFFDYLAGQMENKNIQSRGFWEAFFSKLT